MARDMVGDGSNEGVRSFGFVSATVSVCAMRRVGGHVARGATV